MRFSNFYFFKQIFKIIILLIFFLLLKFWTREEIKKINQDLELEFTDQEIELGIIHENINK
jgi:uncharacterized membrane protein